MIPAKFFRLTPPQYGAKPFKAKIEYDPIRIYSTRATGQWQPDPNLQYEDLLMPAHGPLYEWDVERVNGDELDQSQE
jgi:hypothetical protein